MLGYEVTTSILALVVAGTIIWLIRKDHIHPRDSLWWLTLAFLIGVLGIFPRISDWLAAYLGVSYPPALVLVLSFVVLLIKLLHMDIAATKNRQAVIILSQKLSVLEKMFEERLKLDEK